MKLIIGLGNPGEKHKNNRHNAGYMFVDELKKINFPQNIVAVKSGSFMNDSGVFVSKYLKSHPLPPKDLYVVHDDLDIPLGSYKITFAKGPKNHNGLNSIYDKLGTHDFWHVRVGVDNRDPENRETGEEYVLGDFSDEEKTRVNKVLLEICKKLATS